MLSNMCIQRRLKLLCVLKPAHPSNLIRVFLCRMNKNNNKKTNFASLAIVGAQGRFWSDCINTHADLNLRWAHVWRYVFWRCGSFVSWADHWLIYRWEANIDIDPGLYSYQNHRYKNSINITVKDRPFKRMFLQTCAKCADLDVFSIDTFYSIQWFC